MVLPSEDISQGCTPLQLATRCNCTEAANVLIEVALGISSGFYDEIIGKFVVI